MLSVRANIDGYRWKPQQGQSQPPRLSSDAVRISRSRSRDVIARNNLEVKALEAAVQTINKIMTSHQKRSQQQAQPSDTTEAGAKPAPRGKAKTFSCKSKGNTKRDITVSNLAMLTQALCNQPAGRTQGLHSASTCYLEPCITALLRSHVMLLAAGAGGSGQGCSQVPVTSS